MYQEINLLRCLWATVEFPLITPFPRLCLSFNLPPINLYPLLGLSPLNFLNMPLLGF